jgi:DNA (cytosine-5)-methyltransferase 1
MRCEWQVEIDPYARAVLAKHWPDVRRHEDVRTFPPPEGEWGVDVICGGFPCQDISVAGKGAGLAGARSGLWYEYARIIGELRPRYVIVENVAALLTRGADVVLGTLASLGYDAEWHVISASAVGAPHRRERLWIVAWNANGRGRTRKCSLGSISQRTGTDSNGVCEDVPDADSAGRQQQRRPESIRAEQFAAECGSWWSVEPDVGRVAHGAPARVDRLRCLGNAVVPQIVEVIGRAIVEAA